MDSAHWLQRWQQNQIGFHQDQINPWLVEFWPQLALAAGATVFVPLAGKSLDLWWLARNGHPVLGIELSSIAVEDFFREASIDPQRQRSAGFERCSAEGVELLCGDYFQLTTDDLTAVGAVFDRASLVAMPPAMRADYVAQLLAIVPPTAPILLITMEYPDGEMDGPPFSVMEAEVEQHFTARYQIERVAEADILEQAPQFKKRGLTALVEKAFILRPR